MGSGTVAHIGTYQVKKFVKIPPRRLISGFLYINVINHIDRDGGPSAAGAKTDDFMQRVHDGEPSDGILKSNSFSSDGGISYSNPSDHGDGTDRQYHNRRGLGHSFADYDTFLFFVAGGMSLTGGIRPPHVDYKIDNFPDSLTGYPGNAGSYHSGHYFTRYNTLGENYWSRDNGETIAEGDPVTPTDLSATWFSQMHGDSCCHFIKSHLLSRMNNASGHKEEWDDTAGDDTYYFKHRPIFTHKYLQIPNNEDRNTSLAAEITTEAVLSHGTYANDQSNKIGLTYKELCKFPGGYEDGTSGSSTPYKEIPDLGNFAGWDEDGQNNSPTPQTDSDPNTYYNPVDSIRIYGSHQVNIDSKTTTDYIASPETVAKVYSSSSSDAFHFNDFWNLVIDIGLRSNEDSDKAIMESQINVSFQPFGETREFALSDTEHTE